MARSSNEDQVASNLVEVSVYGITTLYEKFESTDKKTEAGGEPATTNGTSPKTPTPMTPAPMTKDKDPAPMPMSKDKEPTPMPKDKAPMPTIPGKK